MLTRILSFTAVLGTATPLAAQLTGSAKWADSARREIEAGNAAGNLARLTAAIALSERALAVTPNDPWLIYYRALGLYRVAGPLTGQQKMDEARGSLEEADRILEDLSGRQSTAEVLALRGAVLGQLIGVSANQTIAGMSLGPKSGALIGKAMDLAPTNPRVWLVRGMSALHTPAMFGGGTDKAIRDLTRATELFADQPVTPPVPDWGHADAYIWLGQALEKDGKRAEARAAYLKALEISPGQPWVTYRLLPALERGKP